MLKRKKKMYLNVKAKSKTTELVVPNARKFLIPHLHLGRGEEVKMLPKPINGCSIHTYIRK